MNKSNTIFRAVMFPVFSAVLLLSCENNEFPATKAVLGDYFPLGPEHRWEYVTVHRYGNTGFNAGVVLTDTMKLRAERLNWEGNYFQMREDNDGIYYGWSKWYRKDSCRTFEFPAYAREFMFLDADLDLHQSWEARPYGDYNKTEFRVVEVNATKIVNGIRYNHVIEVLESSYWKGPEGEDPFTLSSETRHYYAKDVGEIYSYETYGVGGEEGSIEVTLLRHSR